MNYIEFKKNNIKLRKVLDIEYFFVYNATPFKELL